MEKKYILKSIVILVGLLVSLASMAKQTLVIGVDGLSLAAFEAAQKRGLFKDFKSVSGHIAPFPTMTDLSWSEVLRTGDIFGKSGQIKSVEAVYFDESQQSVEGDVRDYYRRLAQPKLYMNGFQSVFNAYIEGLMYFPTKELPVLEVKSVLEEMQGKQNSGLITGYIGAVDSTAHTQHERLFPVIIDLDRQISAMIQAKRQAGDDFDVVLISDHGNVGRFTEGEKETELTPVEIEPIIKSVGLEFVQKLENRNHVAMPLLALGSWAPVYFKDRSLSAVLVSALVRQPWFDMAFQVLEKSNHRTVVLVTGAAGQAKVYHLKKSDLYHYEVISGNPLELPSNVQSSGGRFFSLTTALVEHLSRQTKYPDSLIRVSQAAESQQFDFPDLILTLKDGFYFNNALGKMTKMYRTHGSLSRNSSLGIVATTGPKLPQYMRSEHILKQIGVKPSAMFAELGAKAGRARAISIREAKESTLGVATGAQDFSQKRIFQQLTKLVSNSRAYFVIDELKSLFRAISVEFSPRHGTLGSLRNFNPAELESKPLVTPQEIGEITDLVIQKPDLAELQKDPRIQSLQKKFGASSESGGGDFMSDSRTKERALLAKRGVMKLYQIPHLLDQSMVVQEKPFVPEVRDLGFAQYWDSSRMNLLANTEKLQKSTTGFSIWKRQVKTIAERLFAEIMKEAVLEDRLAPQVLDTVYGSELQGATIVYVPGTYNGIFDREIFSLGLKSIQEELGARVLKAPMMSACSSQVNGELLLRFLKEDQARFASRREVPPKYVLLGYSKGGNDSLAAFVQDKDFVRKNVLGLVAIASPLKGSAILEKTDLPFQLVNLLIEEATPEICKKEETATSSVSSQAMSRFWRLHEKELIGLTRYFSTSFVANPEESHLYMKVTKTIAQFGEDNDGIVSLSASKFPTRLGAIDLGVVEGDHLSGILSSRFPQKAFMRSLVRALTELGIEDEALSQQIRKNQIMNSVTGLIEGKYAPAFSPDRKTLKLIDITSKGSRLAVTEHKIEDAYDLNKIILGLEKDPAATYELRTKLPSNQLGFDPYAVLDLAKLPDILTSKKVTPLSGGGGSGQTPGIDLSFNHDNMIHYRMDHQWNYESRAPVGADNNPKWGFQAVNLDKEKWLALRSDKNSIRMTTLAYRFKPTEFSKFQLGLKVTQGPIGADPVKGKSGKDDSAFQVWFTLRDLKGVADRTLGAKENAKVYLFGYYWGEETSGENRKEGDVFESYYSNKNVVVTTLPQSFQVVLNTGKEKLGQVINVDRDFAADLKRAYPQLDTNQLEVIAITIQMDSNDVSGKSEAFMKTLRLLPAGSAPGFGRLAVGK